VDLTQVKGLVDSLSDLPDSSATGQAIKRFMGLLMEDVHARGPIGGALFDALKAARDPKDPVYARLGAVERMLATSTVSVLVKSLEKSPEARDGE
jgi:hypothetical protein